MQDTPITTFKHGYDVAVVRYASSPSIYYFKCPQNLGIVKGDVTVVYSANGLGVVEVIDILENNYKNARFCNKATEWVICKVDLTAHNARVESEQRRKWIISQLDEMKENLQDTVIYEAIAKANPAAQALLDELKGIAV